MPGGNMTNSEWSVGKDLRSADRDLVADYWWRRAEGEMTSWVGFQHVLGDLQAAGATEPVLRLARRSVADEYRHAEWCRDWAYAFGHPPGDVRPRTTRPVTFPGASEAENRLLRIAFCCFTESVGCFVLQEVRPHVVHLGLRRQNQQHFADELQHSRVGWGHLSTLRLADKRRLIRFLPMLLDLLPSACVEGPELERDDLVPFGYFTPSLLGRAHRRAIEQVIVPGLQHLGLQVAA